MLLSDSTNGLDLLGFGAISVRASGAQGDSVCRQLWPQQRLISTGAKHPQHSIRFRSKYIEFRWVCVKQS